MSVTAQSWTCPALLPGNDQPWESSSSRWIPTQLLHAGRWASVYRARPRNQQGNDTDYILKMVNPDIPEPAFARNRLAREWQVAKQASHANLTTVLDGDLQAPQAWLVQPDCGSQSLRAIIGRDIAFPFKLWLLRQTCAGLQALHEQHWLHGDVSAENVVLSSPGHATLIDFGFARRLETAECEIDETTPFVGRFAYAAPELFSRQTQLTSASDMYALGVLMHEVFSGNFPFAGYKQEEVIAMKRLVTPPDVRTIQPETPYSLATLIARLLAREPLRRPSTREVQEQLLALEFETFHTWQSAA